MDLEKGQKWSQGDQILDYYPIFQAIDYSSLDLSVVSGNGEK